MHRQVKDHIILCSTLLNLANVWIMFQGVGQVVSTMATLSSRVRGPGIDPLFPFFYSVRRLSPLVLPPRATWVLPGFSLGLEGLVQPKGLGTLS